MLLRTLCFILAFCAGFSFIVWYKTPSPADWEGLGLMSVLYPLFPASVISLGAFLIFDCATRKPGWETNVMTVLLGSAIGFVAFVGTLFCILLQALMSY